MNERAKHIIIILVLLAVPVIVYVLYKKGFFSKTQNFGSAADVGNYNGNGPYNAVLSGQSAAPPNAKAPSGQAGQLWVVADGDNVKINFGDEFVFKGPSGSVTYTNSSNGTTVVQSSAGVVNAIQRAI